MLKTHIPPGSKSPSMESIVEAVADFNAEESDGYRPLLARLKRDGQKPAALIIACSDSRLVLPDQISGVEPGELFVLRNVGNLVPEQRPEGDYTADSSVGAAVDFAIDVLGVTNIIVMGHEDCGAMRAACSRQAPSHNLRRWLSNADNAVRKLDAGETLDPDLPDHDQLALLSVLTQMEHLQTYDSVRNALAMGKVSLHGWFFDIGHAQVRAFDPETGAFAPIGGVHRPIPTTGFER